MLETSPLFRSDLSILIMVTAMFIWLVLGNDFVSTQRKKRFIISGKSTLTDYLYSGRIYFGII